MKKQTEFLTMDELQFEDYLLKAYPNLFYVSETTGMPYCQCGISCPPGWRGVVDRLCSQIVYILGKQNSTNIKICQIKEKFASLRFYYDGNNEVIKELIDFACFLCEDICQETGQCNATVYEDHGWLMNLCPEAIEKYEEKNK